MKSKNKLEEGRKFTTVRVHSSRSRRISKINNPFTDIVCGNFTHHLELLYLRQPTGAEASESLNEKWKFAVHDLCELLKR